VSNAADSKRLLVLALFFEGSLVVSALFLAWYVGLALREQWRVEATAWPEIGLWALPPVVCFFVLVHVPWAPLRRIEALLDEWFVPLLAELKWHEVGLLAALAGIGEELLFRGVLTPWAMDRLGVLWALVLPNVLFGLLHPVTPTYAVLAFVAGLYMSCAWYFTGGAPGRAGCAGDSPHGVRLGGDVLSDDALPSPRGRQHPWGVRRCSSRCGKTHRVINLCRQGRTAPALQVFFRVR